MFALVECRRNSATESLTAVSALSPTADPALAGKDDTPRGRTRRRRTERVRPRDDGFPTVGGRRRTNSGDRSNPKSVGVPAIPCGTISVSCPFGTASARIPLTSVTEPQGAVRSRAVIAAGTPRVSPDESAVRSRVEHLSESERRNPSKTRPPGRRRRRRRLSGWDKLSDAISNQVRRGVAPSLRPSRPRRRLAILLRVATFKPY